MRGHRLPGLKARRIAGGIKLTRLARRANLTDDIVNDIEAGGNCDPGTTERILDALGPSVAVTSSSVAASSVITTAANTFVTGDTVTIAGHTGSTPTINGDRVITRINGTSFSIPVNVSVGGTGGTARLSATTLGIVRMGR